MIDYTNYIQTEDEQILMNYIRQSTDPCALVRQISDPIHFPTAHLFVTFRHLFDGILLSNERISPTKEDQMIFVESIVRHYLDRLRSIDSHQPSHSTSSSSIDLFISNECVLMKKLSTDLCYRMDHLLEVFTRVEVTSPEMESLIRSIPHDSTIVNFVRNYQIALKHLCEMNSNDVNLKFIRRRRQFLQLIRLKRDDNLLFHLKCDHKHDRSKALTVSGVHSSTNVDAKSLNISLDVSCSTDAPVLSSIVLDTNAPCYLPVMNNDKANNSELILLSIDKPQS
ncbi:unnamed protein product [Adineta ricciae]|uniref:Uncharacterized protein n=1 Tax=Adineta ricciae TaxID=249248 RepID=A0A816EU53_ADIRI|nr:unnamed protein product [Adineta ricciae]